MKRELKHGMNYEMKHELKHEMKREMKREMKHEMKHEMRLSRESSEVDPTIQKNYMTVRVLCWDNSLTVGTNVRVLQEVKKRAFQSLTGARGAWPRGGPKLQSWTKNTRENQCVTRPGGQNTREN